MKIGLVLEGGAMRGMFTAGVLDTFLDNDIKMDLLWSSFFVTLVAKKYRLATMLPFVPRMVCDSR